MLQTYMHKNPHIHVHIDPPPSAPRLSQFIRALCLSNDCQSRLGRRNYAASAVRCGAVRSELERVPKWWQIRFGSRIVAFQPGYTDKIKNGMKSLPKTPLRIRQSRGRDPPASGAGQRGFCWATFRVDFVLIGPNKKGENWTILYLK